MGIYIINTKEINIKRESYIESTERDEGCIEQHEKK
jgi:hypothetical protein